MKSMSLFSSSVLAITAAVFLAGVSSALLPHAQAAQLVRSHQLISEGCFGIKTLAFGEDGTIYARNSRCLLAFSTGGDLTWVFRSDSIDDRAFLEGELSCARDRLKTRVLITLPVSTDKLELSLDGKVLSREPLAAEDQGLSSRSGERFQIEPVDAAGGGGSLRLRRFDASGKLVTEKLLGSPGFVRVDQYSNHERLNATQTELIVDSREYRSLSGGATPVSVLRRYTLDGGLIASTELPLDTWGLGKTLGQGGVLETRDGGLIVAGTVPGPGTEHAGAIVKVAADGSVLWRQTVTGPIERIDSNDTWTGVDIGEFSDGAIFVVANSESYRTLLIARADGTQVSRQALPFRPTAMLMHDDRLLLAGESLAKRKAVVKAYASDGGPGLRLYRDRTKAKSSTIGSLAVARDGHTIVYGGSGTFKGDPQGQCRHAGPHGRGGWSPCARPRVLIGSFDDAR